MPRPYDLIALIVKLLNIEIREKAKGNHENH